MAVPVVLTYRPKVGRNDGSWLRAQFFYVLLQPSWFEGAINSMTRALYCISKTVNQDKTPWKLLTPQKQEVAIIQKKNLFCFLVHTTVPTSTLFTHLTPHGLIRGTGLRDGWRGRERGQ